ncbi:MAG: Mpo1-like protein, partial [Myxococcota bacterium]
RPATFTYPLWSLLGDFKLWALTVTFQIRPELDRLGLKSDAHASAAQS